MIKNKADRELSTIVLKCLKKVNIKFQGNIKLGSAVGTISKLYSDDTFNVEVFPNELVEVKGTCSGHCEGCKHECYVGKSYRYPSVKVGHSRTTIAMREAMEELFEKWNAQLSRKEHRKTFNSEAFHGIRINQSGELESSEEFSSYSSLASDHPDFMFWLYTKAYDLIDGLVEKSPTNLYTNISVWGEQGIKEYNKIKHLPNVHAFVYIDDIYDVEYYERNGLHIETFCKAYDAEGHLNHDVTCDKCRKCVDRPVKVIGCYSH